MRLLRKWWWIITSSLLVSIPMARTPSFTRWPISAPAELEELGTPPTMEEVRTALFFMKPLKAPGPGSFQAVFSKKSRDVIKLDLMSLLLKSFSTTIFRRISAILLALISEDQVMACVGQLLSTPTQDSSHLEDYQLVKLANFGWKKIPERVELARGASATCFLEAMHDVSYLICFDFLRAPGFFEPVPD
ncbi:hypothetical protein Nepgr_003787 [Nepenthes gracilis]|uniref:Catalase core domain-containing protein n=1 Tax=Nepenthes gracilis TaxID=150966 RepID=A0AAD3XE62_NEPGR|nr:hypothetical protein Nepgr_003787 [Nepenthes gracilis]